MQADGRRGAGSDGMTDPEDTVNPPMCDLSTLVLFNWKGCKFTHECEKCGSEDHGKQNCKK